METINLSLTYSVKEKVQMPHEVMGQKTKTTRQERRKLCPPKPCFDPRSSCEVGGEGGEKGERRKEKAI